MSVSPFSICRCGGAIISVPNPSVNTSRLHCDRSRVVLFYGRRPLLVPIQIRSPDLVFSFGICCTPQHDKEVMDATPLLSRDSLEIIYGSIRVRIMYGNPTVPLTMPFYKHTPNNSLATVLNTFYGLLTPRLSTSVCFIAVQRPGHSYHQHPLIVLVTSPYAHQTG